MRSPIWKIEEILDMPEFGGKVGWFYGFVWYENDLHFGEIFPGIGFSKSVALWWPEEPKPIRLMFKELGRMIKDVWWATKRKSYEKEAAGSSETEEEGLD